MEEAALVEQLKRRFAAVLAPGAAGLMDDAATLPPISGAARVVSTDQLIEGVHFVGDEHVQSAGWRAIARNLSDLAAMGASPVGFTWTLALPTRWLAGRTSLLDTFARGAVAACARYGLPLLGGDVAATSGPFVCSVTVLGDVRGAPLSRAGARPGDGLFVSRPLGASARGLELVLRGVARSRRVLERRALAAHLWPEPELALGRALVGRASACMDVSDGLLRDLPRLCRASGIGAELSEEELWAAVDPAARALGLAVALAGGEDYALLFSLPPRRRPPRGALRIGRVVEGSALTLVGATGARRPLFSGGFDHFA
jgi:thiamine-monophosphate kinase